MAIKSVLTSVTVLIAGDGSSTTAVVNLRTGPFRIPGGTTETPPLFDLGTATEVFGLTSSSGITVTPTLLPLTGEIKFDWATALGAGSYDNLTMHFKF